MPRFDLRRELVQLLRALGRGVFSHAARNCESCRQKTVHRTYFFGELPCFSLCTLPLLWRACTLPAPMKLLVLLSLVPAIHAIPFAHGCSTPAQRARAPAAFCDATLSHDARVAALVGAMTIPEKVNLTWISGCTSEDPTDGGVGYVGEERREQGVERQTRTHESTQRHKRRSQRQRPVVGAQESHDVPVCEEICTRRHTKDTTRDTCSKAHTHTDKTQADHLHVPNRIRPPPTSILQPSPPTHTSCLSRLGVPGYAWGVEILHGAQSMCLNGSCPTIFPVLVSLASSFNESAFRAVGSAISTEMR